MTMPKIFIIHLLFLALDKKMMNEPHFFNNGMSEKYLKKWGEWIWKEIIYGQKYAIITYIFLAQVNKRWPIMDFTYLSFLFLIYKIHDWWVSKII